MFKASGNLPKSHKLGFAGRFFRSSFAVLLLSSLTLGVFLFVGQVSSFDTKKLASVTVPLLARLHIKADEAQVGEVAGKFVERISDTNLGSGVSSVRLDTKPARPVRAVVAVMSDIHEDTKNFEIALKSAKEKQVLAVFVLGDLSNFGDLAKLKLIKNQLDLADIPYEVLPGDHDLAQTLDTSNFEQVFDQGKPLITLKSVKFLLLDNSANFTTLSTPAIQDFTAQLADADFVLMSQPLYTVGLPSPFDKLFMGSTRDVPETAFVRINQQGVLAQRDQLLEAIRRHPNIKAIIAGDQHRSSMLSDIAPSVLKHYVVGAVSREVGNYPQKVIQSPRYSLMTLYEDGTYAIEDILVD